MSFGFRDGSGLRAEVGLKVLSSGLEGLYEFREPLKP